MEKKRDFRVTGSLATEAKELQNRVLATDETEKKQTSLILEARKRLHEEHREWWDKIAIQYKLDKNKEHNQSIRVNEVRITEL